MAALINYSATFAVTFLLSLYLQYVKGLSAQNAGLILIAQPIMVAIITPFAGRLSDRYEPRILASLGMALVTVGLVIFAFISAQTTFEYIIIGLLVLGLGFGLFSSPNTNAIMGSVERRFFGVASATVSTMRLVGQVLSMGIAMLIFAMLIGRVQILPAQYPALIQSIQITFIIFAVLCFGGIFASMARK
jgi:MFS family permease